MEYYIHASDGRNASLFPVAGPEMPLSLITYPLPGACATAAPRHLSVKEGSLSWDSSPDAFWYRIYRGDQRFFQPGPDTLLTYVEAGTTSFRDNGFDLSGHKLVGTCSYAITAVDKEDRESPAGPPAAVHFKP